MSFKKEISQIIGKTIAGIVVVKEPETYDITKRPLAMVHLVFTDGTSYEINGRHIHFTGGINNESFDRIIELANRDHFEIVMDQRDNESI